jgi:tetratricopeptide (TPR) repeat protein
MWRYLLLGILVIATGGGAVWWWRHTSRPEYCLHLGQQALNRGDDDSLERVILLLEADGQNDPAHLLRGQKFVREGDYSRALVELNRIRDQGELRLPAASLIGRCLLELDQSRGAVDAFRFVLAQQADHLDAHRGLAQGYYNLGQLDAAMRHCQEWARLDPSDGRPYRFLAVMHGELNQKTAAADSCREALRRDLSDRVRDEVRLELAEILVHRNQFPEALEQLDACSDEAVATDKAQTLRAECWLGQGKKDKAAALLDRILARQADPQALRLRAGVYLEREDAKAAVELLLRAVRLEPHQFTGRHLLAQAYQMLGQSTEAQEQLRLVKQTQAAMDALTDLTRKQAARPLDAKEYLHMAELYQQLGLTQMADRSRRMAAAADPAALLPKTP